MDHPEPGFPLDIYNFWGHRIGIRSNSIEVLSHFRSVYGRFCIEGNAGDCPDVECVIEAIDDIGARRQLILNDGNEFYSLRCRSLYEFDQDYYGTGSIPDPIAFIAYLFLKNKYRMIRRYRLFHAAALSCNGRALIFPALERMGKTTLTVQLVKAGLRFLSDEVACIDPERRTVEPYPRSLNINASSCAMLNLRGWPDQYLRRSGTDETEWTIDIEQIVPGSLSPASRLARIIFLRGFAENPRLEPVSSSNALFRLFKYSFNPSACPASQLFTFAPVMNGVACHDLVCGDLETTAALVMDLVSRGANDDDTGTLS